MANDALISGVPRYEYYTWALMILAAPGPCDAEQLALVLREARENLTDAEYQQLQVDLRFLGFGERIGSRRDIVSASRTILEG